MSVTGRPSFHPTILWTTLRRAALATLALLASAGGAASRAEDFVAPGRLYPVFDTTLHMYCLGQGEPAVVFEAGIGGNYLDWTFVQPIVAKTRLACAYDRAGAGWSATTTRPRTAETLAEELRAATKAAGITRRFVLVGHSFGGLLGQVYAARYPDDLAGLVLVDSVHPDQAARFAAVGVDLPDDPHLIFGRTPAAAAAQGLPAALVPLAIDFASQSKVRIFTVREMYAMPAIAAEVAARARCAVPARVLVHGKAEWNDAYPDGRMERAWRAMQADLAARLCAPPPVIVAGSGHQIAIDAPEAIATAIDDIVRTGRP